MANPRSTWHFKQSVEREVAPEARPITGAAGGRAIFQLMRHVDEANPSGYPHVDVDDWTNRRPQVEVSLAT